MDKDTLIAALVGALIATIPILISNIVQIYLHWSENRQKEKEAKTQNRRKWVERDILEVIKRIESNLDLLEEFLSEGFFIENFNDRNKLSPDLINELLLDNKNLAILFKKFNYETRKNFAIIYSYLSSFENEFGDEFDDFYNNFMDYFIFTEDYNGDDISINAQEVRSKLYRSAGKLLDKLRNKLISN